MFKKYSYQEIDNVAFELMNQKAVIIPTDTVIGIISKDVDLIYEIKNRSRNKKIIVFLPDANALTNLTSYQKKFINEFWPGQITIIKDGVSYRIPDDNYLLYLLNQVGPLYSSSANISDQDTITDTNQANEEFDEKFFHKLVLVDGATKSNEPSTIIDIDKWEIIRRGHKINEVESFIDKMMQSLKEVYFLIEPSIYSHYAKVIKKEFKLKSIIQKLTSRNLHQVAKEFEHKEHQLSLVIITNEPLIWDNVVNKIHYLRSGIIYHNDLAELSKKHDDTQVAIFDSSEFDMNTIIKQIKTFLNTEFEGGRHQARIQTILDYEDNK